MRLQPTITGDELKKYLVETHGMSEPFTPPLKAIGNGVGRIAAVHYKIVDLALLT